MLTSNAQAPVVRDGRPGYRPFRADVVRLEQLSPGFRRVTFSGADFDVFGTAGLDQRIKLIFPHADGTFGDAGWDDPETIAAGTWYQRWRDLPDAERNPLRTYTVRAIRPEVRELVVDFVVHGHDAGHQPEHGVPDASGPAAAWLARAAVGDSLIIVGPDAQSVDWRTGVDWHPGDAVDFLLAGDETAMPAICSILEALPAGTRARAFIEVPHLADRVELTSRADVHVSWLGRDAPASALRLDEAVRAWVEEHRDRIAPALSPTAQELADIDVDVDLLWDSPVDGAGRFYAWLAGESAVIKTLRRLLVSDIGVDRRQVAFMGYWRLGRAEGQ